MKVLFVLHSTLPNAGATKAVLALVEQLKRHGVVPVFLLPDKNGIYATLAEGDYDTHCIPFKMSIYPNSYTFKDKISFPFKLLCRVAINMLAIKKIKKLTEAIRPDIIHTNTSVVSLGRIVARQAGIPHVQHIREYGDKDFSMTYFPSWNIIHKGLVADNDCNICITKDIQKHHSLTGKDNALVVYDGVHSAMDAIPKTTNKHFWLYAGRIEYGKGLDILLRAYLNYTSHVDKALPLKVAGSKSDETFYFSIKNYIDATGLTDKVTFLGEIDDIESLMQEATALIIPSRSEGFGFCMPEAMFNGCLCIGMYTAGTKEQMMNGRKMTGKDIAIPFSSEDELTSCLLRIHNEDGCMWNDMKERAFTAVNSLYTYENTAKSVLEIYQKVLAHRKKG